MASSLTLGDGSSAGELAPGARVTHVSDQPDHSPVRNQVIRLLQQIPHVAAAVPKLASRDAYRVIMGRENVQLFKRTADGTYKPFLRRAGKFVGNVDLKKVSPDYVGAASNLLLCLNMQTIAADLRAIKIELRDIGRQLSDGRRGGVRGAINALGQSQVLNDPIECRREMLGACRELSTELGKLVGQLRAHVASMPKPQTFFAGFWDSGLGEAKAKYYEVEQDILLLKDGIEALLCSYANMREPDAAREALLRIIGDLKAAELPAAIKKARLVPVPEHGPPPEVLLKAFSGTMAALEQLVVPGELPASLAISIDFKPEELLSCQTSQKPVPAAVANLRAAKPDVRAVHKKTGPGGSKRQPSREH